MLNTKPRVLNFQNCTNFRVGAIFFRSYKNNLLLTDIDNWRLTLKYMPLTDLEVVVFAFFIVTAISNQYDSDVSQENPDYYYTEYQQIDDRKIKLLQHKLKDYDTDKQKDIVTIEHWTTQNNGEVVKNKTL